jgi:hypothetical protein
MSPFWSPEPGIGVLVGTGVSVGTGVFVFVGTGVLVGSGVSVGTGVLVYVGTGVSVGMGVSVSVGRGVFVGAGPPIPSRVISSNQARWVPPHPLCHASTNTVTALPVVVNWTSFESQVS